MIPNPLLDRMEVIAIAGYITDEKMHIARDYLEKSTLEACGIKPEQVTFSSCIGLSFLFPMLHGTIMYDYSFVPPYPLKERICLLD